MTHTSVIAGKPPVLEVQTNDAARWAVAQRDEIRASVAEHGALLVRGLGLRDADQAAAVFRHLGDLVEETEAFAPRRRYAEGVYSSTKWPPNQQMCMHHELSYAREVPSLMLFACLVPAAVGGATPLADGSAVLESLPGELVARVEREGWILVRNYNEDIGATPAESFGTADWATIERYCFANAISLESQDHGGFRTSQRRSAVVRHPVTGRRCWFNQIAFLNEWTLAPEIREYLVDVYGPNGLPFNTRFGNGDPIGPDVVQTINAAYEAHTMREPWQAGDLLIVDNIRMAHGREPFEGQRELVVAMADPVRVTAS
jgi:alpha-ketoglutarate-dependent taurine dioxygenase